MVSPPDGQSLSGAGTRAERRNDAGNRASKWLQRLLVSTGFVFFVGGLVIVAGGFGVVPFLSDSGGQTTAGGPAGGTATPDRSTGGTPTASGTGNGTATPAGSSGRNGGDGTPANDSDGTTPTSGSGGNRTSTPTPTPDPIIGIG